MRITTASPTRILLSKTIHRGAKGFLDFLTLPVYAGKGFKVCSGHRTDEMKNKSLSIIVLTTLALALFAAIPVNAADTELKVAVQLKGGLEAGQQLLQAMEDFSNVEWAVILEDLTASDLADVDTLGTEITTFIPPCIIHKISIFISCCYDCHPRNSFPEFSSLWGGMKIRTM